MNKPATKEPSMDEILSSIRQIIADEDQGSEPAAGATDDAAGTEIDLGASLGDEAVEEPITLSTDQMLSGSDGASDEPDEDEGLLGGFNPVSDIQEPEAQPEVEAAPLAAPEGLLEDDEEEEALDLASFGSDLVQDSADDLAQAAADEVPDMAADSAADLVVPDDIAFEELEEVVPEALDEPEYAEVPSPDPLPNPDLTGQMADELLAPATNAAVKSTMSKLSALSTITNGVTLDAMVKEMMRPMLKEWLDENLPPMVERVVEREIARIARGE